MNVLRLNFVPALLALILLFVTVNAGEQARKWWTAYTPAVEWHGVEVAEADVVPGGELHITYSATVHKQCPSDLHGFIVAPDGSVPVRFPVVAGGYTRPSDGPMRINVTITVPTVSDRGLVSLKSGPHVYRTLAVRYCPDGVEQDSAVPDAPFNLVVMK